MVVRMGEQAPEEVDPHAPTEPAPPGTDPGTADTVLPPPPKLPNIPDIDAATIAAGVAMGVAAVGGAALAAPVAGAAAAAAAAAFVIGSAMHEAGITEPKMLAAEENPDEHPGGGDTDGDGLSDT
jgi:hypothetical protein